MVVFLNQWNGGKKGKGGWRKGKVESREREREEVKERKKGKRATDIGKVGTKGVSFERNYNSINKPAYVIFP